MKRTSLALSNSSWWTLKARSRGREATVQARRGEGRGGEERKGKDNWEDHRDKYADRW